MAKETAWRCDLCGEFVRPDELRRLSVRKVSDRPEDADVIDVGPECHGRTVSDVVVLAHDQRAEAGHVE